MASQIKWQPFDDFLSLVALPGSKGPYGEGNEGGDLYSSLDKYSMATGIPISAITAPGGNTGNDPGFRAWHRNQVLAGRSPEDYIKSENARIGIGPRLQGIEGHGGLWYDPSTGQVGTQNFDAGSFLGMPADWLGTIGTFAGLAAGAGALSGAMGGGAAAGAGAGGSVGADAGIFSGMSAADLAGSGSLFGGTAAAGTGASMTDLPLVDDWGNWGQFMDFNPGYNAVGANDPIGALVQNLDAGMSSADAVKAVEAALPGSTQSVFQFYGNNPAQLIRDLTSKGVSDASSLASRILGGNASGADWTRLLGALGSTALGLWGANRQQGALESLSRQFAEYGAPSRARYEGSFAPGFTMANEPGYRDALDATSEAILRKLSATGGNPFGTPGALIEANKAIVGGTALPALYNYRNQNAATGGFGAFNTAAPGAASLAATQAGNIPNVIGSGLADLVNPRQNYTLADLTRALQLGGLA